MMEILMTSNTEHRRSAIGKHQSDDPIQMIESIFEISHQIMYFCVTNTADSGVQRYRYLGRHLINKLEKFDGSINWDNIDYLLEELYAKIPCMKELRSEEDDETRGEYYLREFCHFKNDFDKIFKESYRLVGFLFAENINDESPKKVVWDAFRHGWFKKINSFRECQWHYRMGSDEDDDGSFWHKIVLKNNSHKVAA